MAKSNNRQVSNRSAAFAAGMGPSQHRQTLPLRPGSNRAAINKAYYEEGVQIAPAQSNWTTKRIPNQPPMKQGSIVGAAMSAASALHSWNSQLPPESRITVGKAANAARNISSSVQQVFKGQKDWKSMKSGEPNAMNSSYGLSKAPNPRPVNLNSGIVPNTYANDYMKATENLCSPLHMNALTLQIPTDTINNNLATYFIQTIAFDIQTRAQANVGFDLDILNKLSGTKLVTAFNAAINALQIYYYYSSILSYESDPRNKNEGMINLRQNMGSQTISDVALLGRRLEDTPVPRRIVEWVRYMNMNFLSGDSQGAPMIKITFDPTVMDTFTSPTPAAVALANLNLNDNVQVFTLLRRAIPQWRIGTLFDVPTTPVYDKNFVTIFANATAKFYNDTIFKYSHNLSLSLTDTFSYNSFNNRLDGVAFAMSNTVSNAGLIRPGLTTPVATVTADSKRSYYQVGGTSYWINSMGTPFLVASRLESYVFATKAITSPTTPHLNGAEKCQSVNGNALIQTAQNVLDFLFHIDSIPTQGRMTSFNRRGNNRI